MSSRNDPVLLTPEAFVELRRMVQQQRQELITLRRHLQHVSVRRHQAVWPATDQVIQLNHATATVGDIVAANASGVHPGRIKTWNGSGYDSGTAVWLLLTDYYDVDAGAVIGEHGKYYGPAKLAGSFTVSDDTRPLYIADSGPQEFIGKPDADIAKGSSGTVSLWHRSTEADSTLDKTAKALGGGVSSGLFVIVKRIAGQWYVGCWEQ